MPYEKSSSKLENFIVEALNNKEIQDGAAQAELEDEFLASSLKDKSSEIWEAAAKETEAYDQLENTHKTKLAELRKAQTKVGRDHSSRKTIWVLGTSVIVISILVLWSGILFGSVAMATFAILDSIVVVWFILAFTALRSSLRKGNSQ